MGPFVDGAWCGGCLPSRSRKKEDKYFMSPWELEESISVLTAIWGYEKIISVVDSQQTGLERLSTALLLLFYDFF